MDLKFKLRELGKKEERIVRRALSANGSIDFLKSYNLLVRESDVREVYGLTKELKEFLQRFPGLNLMCAGIKLGEVGRRFRFSLEGAFFLVKKDRKRVYVNKKGEMLFLYGRDVFASSVVRLTSDVEENDIVVVCNENGDVLGIGKSRFKYGRIDELKEKEPERVVVENLIDRGEYLRKEKLYESF